MTLDVETAWQGPMWNACGACNFVRRTEGRMWCTWCVKSYAQLARTLAHNLAIAGALCRAHRIGNDPVIVVGNRGILWRPGCGRSAP